MPKPRKINTSKSTEEEENNSYMKRRFGISNEEPKESEKLRFIKDNKVLVGVILTLVLIVTVLVTFILTNGAGNDVQSGDNVDITDLVEREREEAESIKQKFGELYDFGNEDPLIANITDVEVLRKENPEFYEKAKNGDVVVLFTESKLAFLYRTEENKILKVSPVKISEE